MTLGSVAVSEVLLLLKIGFLVLLYLFIWRVVRTASRDLRSECRADEPLRLRGAWLTPQRDLHDDDVGEAQLRCVEVDRVALDDAEALKSLDPVPARGGGHADFNTNLLQRLAAILEQDLDDREIDLVQRSFRDFGTWRESLHRFPQDRQKIDANSASA